MQKLKLDLDSLVVETFATGKDQDRAGTVNGHVYAPDDPTTSLNNQITCGADQTCNGGPSCVSCSLCLSFDGRCDDVEA